MLKCGNNIDGIFCEIKASQPVVTCLSVQGETPINKLVNNLIIINIFLEYCVRENRKLWGN
jgi:hypothetical protein